MKRLTITFITFFFLTVTFGQIRPTGVFVGVEEIAGDTDKLGQVHPYGDPEKPQYKWYHLSYLTFKGDSVFLEQSPIAIYKKDTVFSASDGGFYNYSGTLSEIDDRTVATLKLIDCDYCGIRDIEVADSLASDTIASVDTSAIAINSNSDINSTVEFKTLTIKNANSANQLIVDKNLYRRIK